MQHAKLVAYFERKGQSNAEAEASATAHAAKLADAKAARASKTSDWSRDPETGIWSRS